MRKIVTIILTLLTLTIAFGQSIKELEEQRRNALKRLETTSKVLSETKKTQRSSLNKLNIINKNINERKSLINHINKEISTLDTEINKLNSETRKLERELETYKADYANMVREAYINRSVYSKILFVLSAETFDQSFRRLRYMQEYSEYRKEQMRKIENTKLEIAKKTEQLAQHKKTQVDIKSQKSAEQKKLISDQRKENSVYSDLKKKEKTLQADLKKQQKIANDLNRKIEALIAEEVRKAEEKRRKEEQARRAKEPDSKEPAAKPRTAETGYAMTKEEKLISGNFAANSGRLPWPVDRGFISGKFGVQPHPTLKYVTTNNKGIYIQTPSKTNARAVFEGVVTQRFSVPGSNNGVIIQHGQYRTVYANLTNIYVRVGQKVDAKQSIGQIYTDPENDNKTELFFQIWKERTILNPESWIAR
ncbi:MAG: peptidoglycan DD-metalloendopeptidase family protein [Paludibacter sp.]|jgi:septal ring factor EnvC (AmiA/AmiB activator)|nr:peptidoglycan DD-metalloendopeptidase family protein [Paludibacter sp.]